MRIHDILLTLRKFRERPFRNPLLPILDHLLSQQMPSQPYTFDRVIRIFFAAGAVIAVIVLLEALKGVLLPFVVSCLIAYMLEPFVKWNKRITHARSRFLPVVLTLVEVTAFITLLCFLFIPYIISETTSMAHLLRNYASSQVNVPYISDTVHSFLRDNIDFEGISQLLTREEWKELIKKTITSSWTFLSSGLAFIIGLASWLIVILYVVFIMIDYNYIMQSFKKLLPMSHRKQTLRIFNDIKDAMNRYFRGQALIAFIVGVLFALGFLVIGLPMGVALGLFIGVLNLVPYLQLISFPFTLILCIVAAASGADFWLILWECVAIYAIVQVIQDFYLTPRIMGKAMGLNPAIILLSLSIWGSLLGFMGLIIALPLTTLIISYYDTYVLKKNLIHDA